MPESKLNGKSREDLATIAVVSGLLPSDQAATMTKAELLKFLKKVEQTTSAADEPAATKAPKPPKAPKAPKTPKTPEAPVDKPQATVAVKTAKPKAFKSKVTEPEAAAQEATSTEAAQPEAAKPKAKKSPAKSAATKLPAQAAPVKESVKPSPAPRPARQANVQSRTGKPVAGRSTANRPTAASARTPGKKTGDTRFNKNQKQPQQPTRPMRVKVFGVPSNPLAIQSDEHEAALLLQQQASEQKLKDTLASQAEQKISAEFMDAKDASAFAEDREQRQLDRINREESGEVEDTGMTANLASLSGVGDLPESAETGESLEPAGAPRDKAARKAYIESGESITGVLEIMPDGYGFLRRENYIQGARDAYVPPQYIRRFNLRPGDLITGPCKKQRDNDRYQALLYIKEVNGESPDKMIKRPHFDRLTPIYPDERFILETTRNELSTRIIDLVSPIGKGQRGMIVAPPKAGKTILLQKIANAISENNPDVKLIVLLIDERPEEVTDMQRSINGEVVYSTFDKTPENHVKITELVLERAMRLVELKQDVVILLDSMTRLGRAYNLTITPTGRTLSGGLDPGALHGPKRFFGAARNIENGGSLTIIATSLIETGSRMDEVIFEEFKGTGNMEVLLDRKLSEKRIFPAIDINKSGTRREELLLTGKELDAVWTIRKAFGQLDTAAVTETIINLLLKTQNNQQFISSVNVSFNDKNVFEAMRGTRPGNNNN